MRNMNMNNKIRSSLPFVILIVLVIPNAMLNSGSNIGSESSTAARSSIIINEVMANAADEDTGEFVELYNFGSSSVNVSNWYVIEVGEDENDQIEDYTGPYDWGISGTEIPAGGYCLYVDPEYNNDYNWYLNQYADVSKVIMVTTSQDTTVGNGLTNSGDNVTIRDASLVLVDEYEWTSDPGNNVSWGRYPNGGTTWIAFPKSTPGTSNGDIPDIVINELMYDPEGSDLQGEWVEIYNNDTNPINLTSWELTDSDSHYYTFPTIEFPPDTYIVVYASDGTDDLDFADDTVNLYMGETSSIWTNTGDDVQLNNNAGICIDYINYSNGSSIDPPPDYINWLGELPAVSEGNSLALHPNGWDNDSALDWAEEIGANITKGKNNDEIYGVELQVDPNYQQVDKGGTAHYNLTVKSLGNMDDNIDLNISSQIPSGWTVDLAKKNIHFSPSMSMTSEMVQLTVTAPNDIVMGNMAVVNITAISQNDTNKFTTISTTTVVPGIDIKPNWLQFEGVEGHLEVMEGAIITLKASIKNYGEINSSSFNVTFYSDEVNANNIIETKSYDSINAGRYKYPSVNWDTLNNAGNNTIFIVIDPEDQVNEYNEENNILSGTVNVTPTSTNFSESQILITEVYYDTHIPYEPNEFVKIYNPTAHEVDISRWYIADNIYTDPWESIAFPAGSILKPNSGIYITNDADKFYQQTGLRPEFACVNAAGFNPNLRQLLNPEDWPGFANEGDEVLLRDENRHIVDVVAYGDSEYYGVGWFSNPAPDAPEGKVLVRTYDAQAQHYLDTNTSDDWLGPFYPGVGQSNFGFQTFEFTGTIIPFVSPENTFEVISNELNNAKQSIWINVYQFTHLTLLEVVEAALERGVEVRLILEGEPVGWNLSNVDQEYYKDSKKDPYTEKYVAHRLTQKGAQVVFLTDKDAGDMRKRYTYNHAKYIIIDAKTLLLLSGNLKPSSIPTDPTLGYGNREWGAVVRNTDVAGYFINVFESDWVPLNEFRNDTRYFNSTHPTYGAPPAYFVPAQRPKSGWYQPLEDLDPQPFETSASYKVSPVLSPDTSRLMEGSITGAINLAATSVYVNQADINIDWVYSRGGDRHFKFNWSDEVSRFVNWGDGYEHHNQYLQALVDAALRGCDVKILVDSRFSEFNYEVHDGSQDNELDNIDTILYINQLAELLGIETKLEARLCHLGGLSKVHNKGLIIDGETVLVSSINWNFNSVMNNREAALLIENSKVARFFERVFLSDWARSPSVNKPAPPTTSEREVLITEIYYDTYLSYEPEEFVRITNPTTTTVDLSGWVLTDQYTTYTGYEGTLIFPKPTDLDAGASIYVTKNASAFEREMGFKPDFEFLVDSDPEVRQLEIIDSSTISDMRGPSFSNSGDEAVLTDEFMFFDHTVSEFNNAWESHVIDIGIYAGSEYYNDMPGKGWATPSTIPAVDEGMILKRTLNETTGKYIDTDTHMDWDTPRAYYPGQSNLQFETITFTGSLTAFTSPDSSFEAIRSELDRAQSTLYINLYQFHNPFLMDAVINASLRGVKVKVFLEGAPVGGISDAGRYVAWQLYENGCEVRFIISQTSDDINDRYTYTHAKYAVIDDKTVILGSENWKATGIPLDPTYGNRGWGVALHSTELARDFAEVFMDDWRPASPDSCPFEPGHDKYGLPPEDYELSRAVRSYKYKPRFPSKSFNDDIKVSPVFSPDTNLLQTRSIIEMINTAKSSVYIEQLQCNQNWTDKRGGLWKTIPNMYLEAAIAAARRGCDVKILLDSAFVDINDYGLDNYDTVQYINEIAAAENIANDLEAKLVYLRDTKGLNYLEKVHNKGIIVDSEKTLVSSINWVKGSAFYNREAGVIIEHSGVAKYFEDIFLYDWNLTVNENFNVDVLYSDTHEVLPENSTDYTISILNPDTNSLSIKSIELSYIGLEPNWQVTLSHENVSLAGGEATHVILTVTAPSLAEVLGENISLDAFNLSTIEPPRLVIGIRGYWNGMASDLVFTTTTLKFPGEEPDDGDGDGDAEPPEVRPEKVIERGIDAWIVLVIVIIAVIMGAIIRDYLQHRRERVPQKSVGPKVKEEEQEQEELVEE